MLIQYRQERVDLFLRIDDLHNHRQVLDKRRILVV